MSEQGLPNPGGGLEPVATPALPAPGDVWPQLSRTGLYFMFGVGYLVYCAAALVQRATPLPGWPLDILAGVLMALGIVYAFRLIIRQAQLVIWTPSRFAEGAPERLRAIGCSARLERELAEAVDASFEPIVWRCAGAVYFGELDADGKTIKIKPQKRAKIQTAVTVGSGAPSLGLAGVAVLLISLGAVLVPSRLVSGSWLHAMSTEAMWAVMALTFVLWVFVRPVYVRVAPGVLDVLTYSALGLGNPHANRYDLRKGSVTLDESAGWMCIVDASRSGRSVLFLRPRWLLGPRAAAWVFAAARVSAPTPPLPMDGLTG
jgi:hypothetical protein